jgi:5'-deoxynucleotidase YfbR-like HD superfamily hydrolase
MERDMTKKQAKIAAVAALLPQPDLSADLPEDLVALELLRIETLLKSGEVTRYHTFGARMAQSNAAHSWGVAAILAIVRPDASAELLRAAILHDCQEVAFADIPFPVKQQFPVLRDIEGRVEEVFWYDMGITPPVLNVEEKAVLSAADRLESMLFMHRASEPAISDDEQEAMDKIILDSIQKKMEGFTDG